MIELWMLATLQVLTLGVCAYLVFEVMHIDDTMTRMFEKYYRKRTAKAKKLLSDE